MVQLCPGYVYPSDCELRRNIHPLVCGVTHSEIKNKLVPSLNSRGFDVDLVYREGGQLTERFAYISVRWKQSKI